MKSHKVRKTKYGYYELFFKPTAKELEDYYANKYYQDEEIVFIKNKILQRYLALDMVFQKNIKPSLLDVGGGKAGLLNFLKIKNGML